MCEDIHISIMLVADLIHYRPSADYPAAFQSKLFTIFDSCVDSSDRDHGISLGGIAETPDPSDFQGDVSNPFLLSFGGLR